MSVIQNEALLETLWEEVVEEATNAGRMMSEDNIIFEVRRKFEDLQRNNLKISRITHSTCLTDFMKSRSVQMTLTKQNVKHPQILN